jgi:hypothetical protein
MFKFFIITIAILIIFSGCVSQVSNVLPDIDPINDMPLKIESDYKGYMLAWMDKEEYDGICDYAVLTDPYGRVEYQMSCEEADRLQELYEEDVKEFKKKQKKESEIEI